MHLIHNRQTRQNLATMVVLLPALASVSGCQSMQRFRNTRDAQVPAPPRALSVDHVTIAEQISLSCKMPSPRSASQQNMAEPIPMA